MLVRFWGTRGSIPVALTSADIRRKIEAALTLAIAKGVDTLEKLPAFIAHDLDFPVSQTYGGHSPCVQIAGAGGVTSLATWAAAHAPSAPTSCRTVARPLQ